jgi:ubiquinone/menaquinone biosynthesis C-methylase UbiE
MGTDRLNGALYDFLARPLEVPLGVPGLRRRLLSQARGRVLEIGAGTGANFGFYPPDATVTAVEPARRMRERAEQRARRDARFSVQDAEAEALPFGDGSFDTAVATLAFCSIDDPEKALREAHRVLKPGGKLLLLEHVRKDAPVAGKVLDALSPGWERFTGGCRLNRRLAELITASPFRVERHEPLWSGYGGLWVLVRG